MQALREVTLQVERGEIGILLGHNGAGKSTLLRIASGELAPDSGSALIEAGERSGSPRGFRAEIGFVPQETGLYPTLTVDDNLRFYGEIYAVRRPALSERIAELANELGIAELLARKANTLSPGEAKRVHVASALIHRPSVLLLDEPTAGVDVRARESILRLVKRAADEGCAVFYSTHYFAEAEKLNGSIAVLNHGTIVAAGPAETLIAGQSDPFWQITFDGPIPRSAPENAKLVENTLRISSESRSASDFARVLGSIDHDAFAIRSIELVEPNLEQAFALLTHAPAEVQEL
ncbi:MAG: ABC transporter ATP-binding protein [Solirubrobacterales bacterium]